MTDDNPEYKSGSQLWDRLNQQGDSISDLARAQAATEANLAALAQAVESGFNNINASLNRYAEREARPTNWIGAGILSAALIGSILTFVSLHTTPIRENLNKQYVSIQGLETHRQRTAALEAEMTLVLQELRRLEDFRAESNYTHGQVEELADRVDDIDNRGSRRWNENGRVGN